MKLKVHIRPLVKCIDCGFFGHREGGESERGVYLGSKFSEIYADERTNPDFEYYVYIPEDEHTWNIIGCFHHVWELFGTNTKREQEEAKKIISEGRTCKYFFPYQSGYEPSGHNEMRRDKDNRKMMLYVGLVNAGAVLLAALVTVLLRG